MTKQEFLNQETKALISFETKDYYEHRDSPSVLSRSYACECGYTCRTPNEIYSHALECEEGTDETR
jgi:hypothetical protein